MRPQHVVLIPGFFGFGNLGDFAYFSHVCEFLANRMARDRVAGEVRVVQTRPTASLRKRACRVLETLAELPDGDFHLIGHSSGGLDARLLVSPGAALPSELAVEPLAARVRTVVSLSAPHRGSPLATFLASLLGQQILKVISLITIYTLRTGRVPIAAVFHLVRILSLKRLPIAAGTLLNNVYKDLLSDFSHDRRLALEQFFVEVGSDQELLGQIGSDGMAQFNASTPDRPGVRYGSVVTCVPAPGLRTAWATGLSPFRQATHALFAAFHRISARMPVDHARAIDPAQGAALRRAYGRIPSKLDNDGMVPTQSQVWGEIVHAAWGDHLDAIGHFYLPDYVPPHFDWLNSGAAFTLATYERMWNDVARYVFAE